jgi:hypothetical protein
MVRKKTNTSKQKGEISMKFTMTYHAEVERIDRITACLVTLGMNEFVLEIKESSKVLRLTDTGILFVFDESGNKLITGYAPGPMKVASLYKRVGYAEAPRKMWLTATRNSQRYKFLLE